MSHQDEERTAEMLGSRPYVERSLLVFGYPIKDVMIIVGIIFALGGGWYQI